jgi:hypothetical protein
MRIVPAPNWRSSAVDTNLPRAAHKTQQDMNKFLRSGAETNEYGEFLFFYSMEM